MKKIIFGFFVALFFVGKFGIGSVSAEENFEVDLTDLNDPTVEVSEVLDRNELIKEYADNLDVSLETAQKELFQNEPLQNNSSNNGISIMAVTPNNYRTITKYLSDGAGRVYFYCSTNESRYNRAIVKVLNAGYHSGSKIYAGTFYYHVPNVNRINFILNGHLYNSGTTTVSGGVTIGVGQSASINIGASHTTNYYKPLYLNTGINF